MLYRSETWCQSKDEMAILTRAKKAMIRAMCGIVLSEKSSSQIHELVRCERNLID